MDGWNDFFFAEVGASAALGGLLFVAISLNLERIVSRRALPDRALAALCLLLAVLVVASLMLVPGQPPMVLGAEVLIVGLALTVLGAVLAQRARSQPASDTGTKSTVNLVLLGVAVLPYVLGGIAILAGELSTGLYFIAAAIVFSFIKAVLDAWVLLVEIHR
jgi:hypothetical protein